MRPTSTAVIVSAWLTEEALAKERPPAVVKLRLSELCKAVRKDRAEAERVRRLRGQSATQEGEL